MATESNDRFSNTFAQSNYIKNQIEVQNGSNGKLDAKMAELERNDRKISFNENAEVIDSEDEENATSL